MAAWRAITVNIPGNTKELEKEIKKTIGKTVDGPKEDLESFVEPWRSQDKPNILREVSNNDHKIVAFTGVKSNWTSGKKASPADKLMFVTRGTDTRYATMDSQFRSKTRRRVINTSGGSGRGTRDPVRISRNYPQPGIEAREIEEAIYEKRKTEVLLKLNNTLVEALKKARAG